MTWKMKVKKATTAVVVVVAEPSGGKRGELCTSSPTTLTAGSTGGQSWQPEWLAQASFCMD
jgi:hypothetical protein